MPTFETNVPPPARQPSDKTDSGLASEFRPRRREQWANGAMDETFVPAPIPPEVKKSIDQRISEMMRQTRGPDETFFAIREWFSTIKRVLTSLPNLVVDMVRRPGADDDEVETEAGEGPEGSTDTRQQPRQDKPRNQSRRDDGQKPRPQQQQQPHRGRRGGRRHNRRGHGGRNQNQNPPRGDSGGE